MARKTNNNHTEDSFKYTAERIKYNGKEIQTYSFGTGDNIIFSFPSFPHSGLYYIIFTRHYDNSKFKFITFDLPGWAGWSENLFKDKPYNFETILDITDTILDHYKVTKFNLIGYSFGGAFATKYAADNYDKVNNLVIVSPVVHGGLINGEPVKYGINLAKKLHFPQVIKLAIIRQFNRYKKTLRKNNISSGLLKQYETMLKNMDARVLLEGAYSLFNIDLRRDIEKLKRKKNILIINSEDEEKFFRKQAEFLRRNFEGEETYRVTGTHDDFIVKPRSEKVKTVLDFLLS